jgi:hypothetical protein
MNMIAPIIRVTMAEINKITPNTNPPKVVKSISPLSLRKGKFPKNMYKEAASFLSKLVTEK